MLYGSRILPTPTRKPSGRRPVRGFQDGGDLYVDEEKAYNQYSQGQQDQAAYNQNLQYAQDEVQAQDAQPQAMSDYWPQPTSYAQPMTPYAFDPNEHEAQAQAIANTYNPDFYDYAASERAQADYNAWTPQAPAPVESASEAQDQAIRDQQEAPFQTREHAQQMGAEAFNTPTVPRGRVDEILKFGPAADLNRVTQKAQQAWADMGYPPQLFDIADSSRIGGEPSGGMYRPDSNSITLGSTSRYQPRGEETAIHENLHALEANLSPLERQTLNSLLAQYPPPEGAPLRHHPLGTDTSLPDWFDYTFAGYRPDFVPGSPYYGPPAPTDPAQYEDWKNQVPPAIADFIRYNTPRVAARTRAKRDFTNQGINPDAEGFLRTIGRGFGRIGSSIPGFAGGGEVDIDEEKVANAAALQDYLQYNASAGSSGYQDYGATQSDIYNPEPQAADVYGSAYQGYEPSYMAPSSAAPDVQTAQWNPADETGSQVADVYTPYQQPGQSLDEYFAAQDAENARRLQNQIDAGNDEPRSRISPPSFPDSAGLDEARAPLGSIGTPPPWGEYVPGYQAGQRMPPHTPVPLPGQPGSPESIWKQTGPTTFVDPAAATRNLGSTVLRPLDVPYYTPVVDWLHGQLNQADIPDFSLFGQNVNLPSAGTIQNAVLPARPSALDIALTLGPAGLGAAGAIERGVGPLRAAFANTIGQVLPTPGDFLQGELRGAGGNFARAALPSLPSPTRAFIRAGEIAANTPEGIAARATEQFPIYLGMGGGSPWLDPQAYFNAAQDANFQKAAYLESIGETAAADLERAKMNAANDMLLKTLDEGGSMEVAVSRANAAARGIAEDAAQAAQEFPTPPPTPRPAAGTDWPGMREAANQERIAAAAGPLTPSVSATQVPPTPARAGGAVPPGGVPPTPPPSAAGAIPPPGTADPLVEEAKKALVGLKLPGAGGLRKVTSAVTGSLRDPYLQEVVNVENALSRRLVNRTVQATDLTGLTEAEIREQAAEILSEAKGTLNQFREDVLRKNYTGSDLVKARQQLIQQDAKVGRLAANDALNTVNKVEQFLKTFKLGGDIAQVIQGGGKIARTGVPSTITGTIARGVNVLGDALGKGDDILGLFAAKPAGISKADYLALNGLELRGAEAFGLDRPLAAAKRSIPRKIIRSPLTISEWLGDLQGSGLKQARVTIAEGLMLQAKLIGQDISDPQLLRTIMDSANMSGNTARGATTAARSQVEKLGLLSSGFTRAQFAEMSQPLKTFRSPTDALITANQVVSTLATVYAAYQLQNQFGVKTSLEDFIHDHFTNPETPGDFGKIVLKTRDSQGKHHTVDVLPQFSAERAIIKSLEATHDLAKGDASAAQALKQVGDALVFYGIGRSSAGIGTALGAGGYGYGTEGQHFYGDMPLGQRAAQVAPIPLGATQALTGAHDAITLGLNLLGGNVYGQSPSKDVRGLYDRFQGEVLSAFPPEVAPALENIPYNQLTSREKEVADQVLGAKDPKALEALQKQRDESTSPLAQAHDTVEKEWANNTQLMDTQLGVIYNGSVEDVQAVQKAFSALKERMKGVSNAAYGSDEYKAAVAALPPNDFQRILSEYQSMPTLVEQQQGYTDWNLVQKAQTNMLNELYASDPEAAQRLAWNIQDRTDPQAHLLVQLYDSAQPILSPYFDLPIEKKDAYRTAHPDVDYMLYLLGYTSTVKTRAAAEMAVNTTRGRKIVIK